MKDRTLMQRFELKYVLRQPEVIPKIRDFLSSHMDLDEFSVGRANFEYPVHSIYLDSDDFYLANQNSNAKNRFKLRMRYYKEGEDQPVFFEKKHRIDNVIMKQRAGMVGYRNILGILDGLMPQEKAYFSKGDKYVFAVDNFIRSMQAVNAKPKIRISYMRAAWVDEEFDDEFGVMRGFRATLDSKVHCGINEGPYFVTSMRDMIPVWNHTVLELKFTNRFPRYFKELVEIVGCNQEAGPKCRDGVRVITGRCNDSDRIIPISDKDLNEYLNNQREILGRINGKKNISLMNIPDIHSFM